MTLKHFKHEYLAHVQDRFCSTGECKSLAKAEILADKCKGCRMCIKQCPVNAISGELKKAHSINETICIKCGACATVCKLDAIVGV